MLQPRAHLRFGQKQCFLRFGRTGRSIAVSLSFGFCWRAFDRVFRKVPKVACDQVVRVSGCRYLEERHIVRILDLDLRWGRCDLLALPENQVEKLDRVLRVESKLRTPENVSVFYQDPLIEEQMASARRPALYPPLPPLSE